MGQNVLVMAGVFLLSVWLVPGVFGQSNLWDPLRPISSTADTLVLPIEFIALFMALGILVVAGLAYRRQKSRRFLFLFLAFSLFALKWLILISDEFFSPGNFISRASSAVIDVVVLILLFSALFQSG